MKDRLNPNSLRKERIPQSTRLIMGTLGNLMGLAERLESEFPDVDKARIATIKGEISKLRSSLGSLLEQDAGKSLEEVKRSLGEQSETRGAAQESREC